MPRSCQTAAAGWDTRPSCPVPKVGAFCSSLARKPRALLQFFLPGQEALELAKEERVRGTRRSKARSSLLPNPPCTHNTKKQPLVSEPSTSKTHPLCREDRVLLAKALRALSSRAAESTTSGRRGRACPHHSRAGGTELDASAPLGVWLHLAPLRSAAQPPGQATPLLLAPRGVSQLCHSSKALLHPLQSQQDWKEGSCAATLALHPTPTHKPFSPVFISLVSSCPLHPQRANLPNKVPQEYPPRLLLV